MKVKVLKFDNSSSELEVNIDTSNKEFDAEYADVLLTRQMMFASSQGTKKSKGRSEVRGTSAKPFRQKGTGRARQGSTKGPHFRGGGVAHGAKPLQKRISINKKHKSEMMKDSLRNGIKENSIQFIEVEDDKAGRVFFEQYPQSLLVYATENKDKLHILKNSPYVHLTNIASFSNSSLKKYKTVFIDTRLKDILETLVKE